jgi:hypothetical protein
MVMIGLGLYLPYVSVHTTIFERFIAITRERGNIAFLMYLADSFGYLGYVGVLVARNVAGISGNFASFFTTISWTLCLAAAGLMAVCTLYFCQTTARRPTVGEA